jgi:hypothetical protein
MAVPYITSFTGDGASYRNDFDGCLGGYFTVGGSNITISQLGRWMVSGNSASHTVKILDSSSTLVVQATVNMSGGTPGTFVYTSIADTVLTASTKYYLVSSEANGGDQWNDQAFPINLTVTADATWGGAAYQSSCSGAANDIAVGLSNNCYVPPNMMIGAGGGGGRIYIVSNLSGLQPSGPFFQDPLG